MYVRTRRREGSDIYIMYVCVCVFTKPLLKRRLYVYFCNFAGTAYLLIFTSGSFHLTQLIKALTFA